jgi:fibronectin-binding autotransporter adhesin
LGATANWSDPNNWSFQPMPPTNGDTLIFPPFQPRPNNTNDIASLTLDQIRILGSNYILNGNAFTLTNSLVMTNVGLSGASIIEVASLNLGTTDLNTLVGSGATLTLGTIVNGAAGIVKTGPGTLHYSGDHNSYTGTTTVNAGTLLLDCNALNEAFAGPLIVGDGSDSATTMLAIDRELPIDQPITINTNATLDLNTVDDIMGASLTLNGNGSVVNANPLTLASNATVTVNLSTFFVGNASISGALNVRSNGTCTFVVNPAPSTSAALLVPATVRGSSTILKTGAGFMSFSASNSFSGPVNIANGTLSIGNPYALGATNAGTTVSNAATLWIAGVSVTNEPLTIASTGIGIENASGANNWVGPITLAAQTTFQIDGASLNLQGLISGSGGFTKTSAGTLRLTSSGNSYAGNTTVNQGVLELNGPNVIRFGTLTIGDGLGGLNADVVRYVANFGIYGGSGGSTVVITPSGLLDLNGFTDDVGPIYMDGGTINTGTGVLELFTPLVTYQSNDATNGDSTINGNLNFSTSPINTVAVSNTLVINAVISDANGYPVVKTGPGFLYVNGANTYTGPTLLQQGWLWAQNNLALGATNGGTIVSNGATLVLVGNIGITNESLTLNGPGESGWTALDCEAAETNIWAGPITLAADSNTGNYNSAGALRIIGPIGGPGGLHEDYSGGTLVLEGPVANNYTGLTTNNPGTVLRLSKSVFDGAINGNLHISGTLRLAGNNQIANSSDVFLEPGSLFDFSIFHDRIDTLRGAGNVSLGLGGWIELGGNNGSSIYNGSVIGTGYTGGGYSVAKFGTGTFTMNNSNTFTAGAAHVFAGKLVMNGSQPQVPIIVESGSTFGGTGIVSTIAANGTISPGNSPGILSSSNVTFSSSADLTVELAGPNPGAGGYDQLNVRGTVSLGNAALTVIPTFSNPVALGQTFMIISNDLADAVTGTFTGLPEGAGFSINNFGFTISYVGGSGNDVVLTLTNVPMTQAGFAVSLGNGNGSIDPNECDYLNLMITNKTGTPITGITATLASASPNVTVTQPFSTYPDVPGNGTATNIAPFQISTTPNFTCGSSIILMLTVNSASQGGFSFPVTVTSGSPAAVPLRYDNSIVTNIPDVGTIESTNVVAGFTGPLEKVAVSLWLTHPLDSDLTLSLVSPDNTTITLVSATGAGPNFGSSCSPDANRTTFDDAAATLITAGSPPFQGTFRPQGSLASFNNTTPNGNWRLRITDSFAGTLGALRCWSLFLYPVTCAAGSGLCELCPNVSIAGATGPATPTQIGFVTFNGISSACGAPKACPGTTVAGPYPTDNYLFRNGPSDACITVTLENDSPTVGMLATVYSGTYDPTNPDKCVNYLADGGFVLGAGGPPTETFSFNVTSNATFTVNIVAGTTTVTPYKLTLSGGDCRPVLNITPIAADNVQLDWTTAAAGFRLEHTNTLVVGATNWPPDTNIPAIVNSRFRVTNNAASGNQFYRLHKP